MSEDLSRLSLEEFSERLGSESATPGGGSAAAYCGALGAALAEMVARINSKRKGHKDPKDSLNRAERIKLSREEMLAMVTKDAEAFGEVSRLWKSKSPELEKALRDAAESPLSICRMSLNVLTMANEELPFTSSHLVSDLSESGLLLGSAFESASMNVETNLRALKSSAIFIKETRESINAWRMNIIEVSSKMGKIFWENK